MTDATLYTTLAGALTFAAVIALGLRLNGWLVRRHARMAWKRAMRRFDRKIADRRAKHQSVRDVEAERSAFVVAALRAGGAPSAWPGERS